MVWPDQNPRADRPGPDQQCDDDRSSECEPVERPVSNGNVARGLFFSIASKYARKGCKGTDPCPRSQQVRHICAELQPASGPLRRGAMAGPREGRQRRSSGDTRHDACRAALQIAENGRCQKQHQRRHTHLPRRSHRRLEDHRRNCCTIDRHERGASHCRRRGDNAHH